MQGSTNKRIAGQASPSIKRDPMRKIPKVKRAGDETPVVQHLPSKQEALNSTSRLSKKKKKKEIAKLKKSAKKKNTDTYI
jgi:hypothetical protein